MQRAAPSEVGGVGTVSRHLLLGWGVRGWDALLWQGSLCSAGFPSTLEGKGSEQGCYAGGVGEDDCGGQGGGAAEGGAARGGAPGLHDHCFVPDCELFGALRAALPGWEHFLGYREGVENAPVTYTGSLLCSCNTFFCLWCFYDNHKNILHKIQFRSKLIYLYFLSGIGLAGPRWNAA